MGLVMSALGLEGMFSPPPETLSAKTESCGVLTQFTQNLATSRQTPKEERRESRKLGNVPCRHNQCIRCLFLKELTLELRV